MHKLKRVRDDRDGLAAAQSDFGGLDAQTDENVRVKKKNKTCENVY